MSILRRLFGFRLKEIFRMRNLVYGLFSVTPLVMMAVCFALRKAPKNSRLRLFQNIGGLCTLLGFGLTGYTMLSSDSSYYVFVTGIASFIIGFSIAAIALYKEWEEAFF